MFILDDILLAPLKGLYKLAKVIEAQVEHEQYDEDKLKQELIDLQLKFELDEISEEEYDAAEEAILLRIAESKKRGRKK